MEMDSGLNEARGAALAQAGAPVAAGVAGAEATEGGKVVALPEKGAEDKGGVELPEGIAGAAMKRGGAAAPTEKGAAAEDGEAVASPKGAGAAAAGRRLEGVSAEIPQPAAGENAAPEAGAPEGEGMDSPSEAGFRAELEALIRRAEDYARRAVEGEARAAAALLGVPEKRLGLVAKLADLSGIDPADGEARAKVIRAVRAVLAEVPELGGAGTGSAAPVSRKRRDAFARGFLGE